MGILKLLGIGILGTIIITSCVSIIDVAKQSAEESRVAKLTPDQRAYEAEQKEFMRKQQIIDDAKKKIELAGYACERVVKTMLRDPDSWQKISQTPGVTTKKGSKFDYVATVTGRARNGFGGMNVSTYVCRFKHNDNTVEVESVGG